MADDKGPKISGILFGLAGNFTVDPEEEAMSAIEFGPGFDEMFDQAVRAAREVKEMAVVNGPEDLPTTATAIMPQGMFELPVQEMCDQADLRPPDALGACLAAVSGLFGKPIAVVLLLEALFRRVASEDDIEHHVLGDLTERWNRGDRSGLGEALVVTFATPLQYRSEFMPYHYGDGTVVWEEGGTNDIEGWPDVTPTGNVETAMQMAFRQEGGTDGTG